MGKTRTRASRKTSQSRAAASATGMPSVRDLEKEMAAGGAGAAVSGVGIKASPDAADDDSAVRAIVQNIVEKLQSSGVEDKDCACCTLSSLAAGKTERHLTALLESGVVRIAGPLIVDRSLIVRHSAITALRTMSECGDPAVCEKMIEQDMMTPLAALFKQSSSGWRPMKPVPGKTDSVEEIFVEAVHLFWNLCESSNKAVRIFNKEQLLPCLMPFLDVSVYGPVITIAVAYCLHTVSEDNAQMAANLCETANAEVITGLVSMTSSDASLALLRILAAGMLLNMNCGRLSGCSSSTVSCILRAVSDTIVVDVRPMLSALQTKIQDKEVVTDGGVKSLEWLVSAQEVALEVLINACCNDDEGETWDEVDSSDASDEMPCFDVDMESGEETANFLLCVPVEVQEALASYDFLSKLPPKLCPLDSEVASSLHKSARGKQLCKRLLNVQNRALLCVNNLTSCLEVDELGGPAKLFELWIELGKLTFTENEESRTELLEAATSAMRAVVQKLAEFKARQFGLISLPDLQKLCDLGQGADDANVRCNVVRMVASLGCLLFNEDVGNPLLPMVGTFLLDVVAKDVEVWVQSEALDAVFDMFADEKSDPVAVHVGLVDRLKQITPAFKKKVNMKGLRSLGCHAPIVATAKSNLARFIRYKSNTSDLCTTSK